MNFYPYSAPIILTDTIFNLYGGHTGSSVAAQRQAAYLIAEMAASDDIGSFLLPTIVTGTFLYGGELQKYILDQGYINQVYETRFIDKNETTILVVDGTNNDFIALLEDERGVLMVGGCNFLSNPFNVQFVYNAGLPSGTSYMPDVLLGLTTYADIILNEIIGYGNEAPGDIGVKDYKNQQYSESRVALLRTMYGTSARAQFVHKLFTRLRRRRWVGL